MVLSKCAFRFADFCQPVYILTKYHNYFKNWRLCYINVKIYSAHKYTFFRKNYQIASNTGNVGNGMYHTYVPD